MTIDIPLLQETVTQQLELCQRQTDELAEEAQMIIDSYFTWWKFENQQRLNLQKQSGNSNATELGNVAPRIRRRTDQGESGKLYIEWVEYPNGRRKGEARRWGNVIKPTARGYTEKQLATKATAWEMERVSCVEAELKPIRELLDVIHAQRVAIARFQRKHTTEE
ncbi:hypothetical protein K0504_10065 [Neiella marina]|uniref:Uncharacterized protein n=1 Tax=Neiella holothuriorum TaxID=2870530 RepID=A0ABS7EGE9_9GAMM|nr:conjugative transfer protein MobI(A/C) [Neiella holothuriorum]MBW8191383.1 hypothetical protein [Neiella holothuriorum]